MKKNIFLPIKISHGFRNQLFFSESHWNSINFIPFFIPFRRISMVSRNSSRLKIRSKTMRKTINRKPRYFDSMCISSFKMITFTVVFPENWKFPQVSQTLQKDTMKPNIIVHRFKIKECNFISESQIYFVKSRTEAI